MGILIYAKEKYALAVQCVRHTMCQIQNAKKRCQIQKSKDSRPVRLAYQPPVLFSRNKPATSNQPAVLFSHNKSAPAISHQPNLRHQLYFPPIYTLARCAPVYRFLKMVKKDLKSLGTWKNQSTSNIAWSSSHASEHKRHSP
jgi:hypothetical protein